jgi:broad specificity phosphatase PhoE
MARLYLIRHGRPSSTWGGGEDDPGLDDAGLAQAAAARDWLLSRPVGERPVRVVSSPLKRCRETAQPTADALGVKVEIDPVVGEIPTPWALPAAERPDWLRKVFLGTWAEIKGNLDYEVWRTTIARTLLARGDTAVFSHYVAINAVVSLMAGDPKVLVFRPDHASITVLETDGRSLQVISRGAEAETTVL